MPFQIVGIGSSAGGIEALTQLFSALSADTGMAIVVVQHLDLTHESMIVDIIGRTTTLKTVAVEDNVQVEPNHIYVLPPGKNMAFGAGKLQLSERTEVRGLHRPIDQFFCSLAQAHGDRSIAVILSGMGSDGTLGLEEIKAAGGITFAQDKTAQHPSMPHSAITTGCIDMVLAPVDIARELARIGKHPLLSASPALAPVTAQQWFDRIIDNLRDSIGVDFSHYKRNTLHRRIMRRMVLHKYEDLLCHDKDGQAAPGPEPTPAPNNCDGSAPHEEIERLRQELAATRDYLQQHAANEELQSTNEELETSKEEIQSSNEELETVNDKLHLRNLELSQSNNDLLNLLSSAHLPIVILGRDLVIRRLTPAAEKMLNLIPGDVGRPISDIKLSVQIEDLEQMLLEVIDTGSVRECEVQDIEGRYFLVRVRPHAWHLACRRRSSSPARRNHHGAQTQQSGGSRTPQRCARQAAPRAAAGARKGNAHGRSASRPNARFMPARCASRRTRCRRSSSANRAMKVIWIRRRDSWPAPTRVARSSKTRLH